MVIVCKLLATEKKMINISIKRGNHIQNCIKQFRKERLTTFFRKDIQTLRHRDFTSIKGNSTKEKNNR